MRPYTLPSVTYSQPRFVARLYVEGDTPVLTVRFEGHTPAAMARIQREMMSLLQQVKPDARIG